ncbi:MAG: DNA-binding protein [Mariprofundaceae bacterium]|nr:DNA-binding protein [Mariprofundaceae bacterium]
MTKKMITEKDVFEAAAEIVARGEAPSTLSIHKTLGRGSYSTIQKHLKLWEKSEDAREVRPDELPATVVLPEALAEDVVILGKKLWKSANALAEANLEQERQALNALKENLETSTHEAIDYADQCSQRTDVAEEELKQTKATIVKIQADADQKDSLIAQLKNDLEHSNRDISNIRNERDSAIEKAHSFEISLKLAEQAKDSAEKSLIKFEKKSEKDLADTIEAARKSQESMVANLTKVHENALKSIEKANNKTEKKSQKMA